jgi:acetyl-CoA synthetase
MRPAELQYDKDYPLSIEQPQQFWAEQANKYVTWFKQWHTVLSGELALGNVRWFDGAELNVAYNCLDRHLPEHADHVALLWQGDEADQQKSFTYRELHLEVCKFANVLKSLKIVKGDRVCLYMPMIPEAVIAMLACARIGAVHSVVFAGFSPEALKDRILDARTEVVITADQGIRGGRVVHLKQNVENALKQCPDVRHVVVVKRTGAEVPFVSDRDVWYHQVMEQAPSECAPEVMQAEDPFFILYTSGSTGKPKGVLHTTGGYLLYAAMTFKEIFTYQPGQVYWCTADVGWITGHSYIVYGPLANAATTLVFEGTPMYPTPARCWEIIDQYQVNIFYTAPTAIRALMREGEQFLQSTTRSSLTLLGSVGEPINPEVWQWYYDHVGNQRCPIVDTWWQTETGGIMISALPGQWPLKAGSATKPFYGINPALVNAKAKIQAAEAEGALVITQPWPGMFRTIYNDHKRYLKTYFSPYAGMYCTGDGARRDADNDYWITGRTDDVLNVSGHRLGTAEIESAIVLHDRIAEAAVVGFPHDIKGQGVYAYIVPMQGVKPTEQLQKEIAALVRAQIGPIASIDKIQWCEDLPKTRSGKIMRRILRKIACGEADQLGDISTLANPEIVKTLIQNAHV